MTCAVEIHAVLQQKNSQLSFFNPEAHFSFLITCIPNDAISWIKLNNNRVEFSKDI